MRDAVDYVLRPRWADLLDADALSPVRRRGSGCPFDDPDAAGSWPLAHRSWCAEHAGLESNERLEFLGDAVLGLVVTDARLPPTFPDLPEGELAKVRASVVSAAALAEVAAEVGLGDVLLLGKGEDASGGREKPSILADAMEAVIGAVYLDQGWAAARQLVLRPARRAHRRGRRRARRPGLQDPAAGAGRPRVRGAARLRAARRGPRPRQAVLRAVVRWAARPSGRARGAARRRPSRPRARRAPGPELTAARRRAPARRGDARHRRTRRSSPSPTRPRPPSTESEPHDA